MLKHLSTLTKLENKISLNTEIRKQMPNAKRQENKCQNIAFNLFIEKWFWDHQVVLPFILKSDHAFCMFLQSRTCLILRVKYVEVIIEQLPMPTFESILIPLVWGVSNWIIISYTWWFFSHCWYPPKKFSLR